MMNVEERLFELRDEKFKSFHASLIPTVNSDTIIGVRIPLLRKIVREIIMSGYDKTFLADLPHKYYEENTLHALIISQIKDFNEVIFHIERFLPFVDNWATCDSLRPTCFKKHLDAMENHVYRWIGSNHLYTVRFGIEMLMVHYLETPYFKSGYHDVVAGIKSYEYYINMMISWYFATSLSKQYERTLPYLQSGKLSKWVHNKTIQKARESFRISDEQKEYLRTLKI